MRQIYALLFSFLIFIPAPAYSQENTPTDILFVGNSYTYFWNLPQNVALMAEDRGLYYRTRQSTSGGVNLGQHWRSEKLLKTRDLINSGQFEAVILQDHSLRALEAPDSLSHYVTLLGREIKRNKGQLYLYSTWAREWDPLTQKTINSKYIEIAKKTGAQVLPVGEAWQLAKKLRPDIPLYDDDGSHPSSLGTYLTACVIFGVIADSPSLGLSHRLMTKDKDGEKLYINIQSKENVKFCQRVADQVVREMKSPITHD